MSSRGGMYGPGSPYESVDFQEKYLRSMLGFLGITVITAEGVALGLDKAVAATKAKIAELR